MSKRIATAVAILGAGFVSGCAIEQPSAGCIVQDATDAPWQAAYILKNPADASKSCGQLQGEAIGVFKFVNPYPEKHPEAPKARLAIRPEGTAGRFAYTYTYEEQNADGTVKIDPKTGKPVKKTKTDERVNLEALEAEREGQALEVMQAASGMSAGLADEPDAKGLCKASDFEEAKVSASAVHHIYTNAELVPQENVSYKFGDVFVYSHPSAPGTQLEGSMTYTETYPDGTSCSAEYRVLALWPQVPCDMDAFEHPTAENAADRCAEGSGLNPDFDAVCMEGINGGDPGCVPNPAKGVPSFK
jgi:hypothetical protein